MRRYQHGCKLQKALHLMIERDITNAQLMRDANISANIITKLKNGQYIALDKVESICLALNCALTIYWNLYRTYANIFAST